MSGGLEIRRRNKIRGGTKIGPGKTGGGGDRPQHGGCGAGSSGGGTKHTGWDRPLSGPGAPTTRPCEKKTKISFFRALVGVSGQKTNGCSRGARGGTFRVWHRGHGGFAPPGWGGPCPTVLTPRSGPPAWGTAEKVILDAQGAK